MNASWIQVLLAVFSMGIAATVVVVRVEGTTAVLTERVENLGGKIQALGESIRELSTTASRRDNRITNHERRISVLEDRAGLFYHKHQEEKSP